MNQSQGDRGGQSIPGNVLESSCTHSTIPETAAPAFMHPYQVLHMELTSGSVAHQLLDISRCFCDGACTNVTGVAAFLYRWQCPREPSSLLHRPRSAVDSCVDEIDRI